MLPNDKFNSNFGRQRLRAPVSLLSSSSTPASPVEPDSLTAVSNSSSVPACTVAYVSTHSDGLLIAGIQCGSIGFPNSVLFVDDTTGLPWTERMVQVFTPAGDREISLWTAPFTGIYTGAITSHLVLASTSFQRLYVGAVTGANSSPMDTNANNPSHNNNAGTQSQSISAAITTNAVNTMLISLMSSNSALGTITMPPGFTKWVTGGTTQDFAFKVNSTPISETETWSWTGASDYCAAGIIAIRGS